MLVGVDKMAYTIVAGYKTDAHFGLAVALASARLVCSSCLGARPVLDGTAKGIRYSSFYLYLPLSLYL